MSTRFAKMIEEKLRVLDYEPKLAIERMPIPISRWIILSDGRSSQPTNPTTYVINEYKSDDFIYRDKQTFAVMLAARAVRRRSQSGDKKPIPFLYVVDLDKSFTQSIENLIFESDDEYTCDAEIVSRIAGDLFETEVPMEEIKAILIMDASMIIKKLGMKRIQESMYI